MEPNAYAAPLLRVLAMLLVAASAHAQAPAPRFSFPVECEVGTSCMVQNYFDHDAGSGARDYHCGALTYDGHDGTDVRLPNVAAMRSGVRVLAAADGTVRAIRDGVRDVSVREISAAQIKGREAGNGVAIVHGEGWETQYSHLREGSVVVKPGDRVRRGQALGMIGLSGATEFPHLHFTVRHEGKALDPFTGTGPQEACGGTAASLWSAPTLARLTYVATGVLASGFAGEVPTFAEVKDGRTAPLEARSAALTFWVSLYGVQAGDEERIRVVIPDGRILADVRHTAPERKAEWFTYTGRKRSSVAWPAGVYRAEYTLVRKASDGTAQTVLTLARETTIAP